MKHQLLLILVLSVSGISHASLFGEAKYYVVPLGELGFKEGEIREFTTSVPRFARSNQQLVRYPVISIEEANSTAYISRPENDENNQRRWWGNDRQNELQVALKLPNAQTARGKLSLATFRSPERVAYEFEFDPKQFEEASKSDYESVRAKHYTRLAQSTIPGGDWFRYKAGDAYKADERANRWRNLGQFDSTFNMFTGQRAVSENLALDRELILGNSKDGKPVDVSTIKGVTVEAIDWSERIVDAPTPIDPLAMIIPHNQHAAFFDSIKDLNQVVQLAETEGLHYFGAMTNRKTYDGLAKKYQRQMGLLIPDILAETMPVKSVAITGGDPFLPSGSDLCIIFGTEAPQVLMATLHAMIQAQATINGGNLSSETTIDGSRTYGYGNSDRSFSSYLTAGENYVAVSNSLGQLTNINRVLKRETPSLGSLEEFKFFRQRYPLKDEASAFVFLSDATIRRWASPAFRIAAARRTRAAAVIGQATAQHIDGIEIDKTYQKLVGELSLHGQNTVHSEIFNTLEFLTPVSDIEIDTVSSAEKEGYERWRRGYESGWVRFDPIALSIDITEQSLGVDLSVIPLRLNSDYEEWIRTAGEATLDQQAMTPHPESLLMVSHAIDTSSDTFRMANTQSSAMLPGIGANPLAWVGDSLSIFVDQDPFWDEMNQAEDSEDFIEENLSRLPVGLHVSCKSPMKLALFLTTLRSFSEQAAPGLLNWETREHEETPYVVIHTTERAGLPNNMEIKIHYAAMPEAFILTLNEDILKRAITRNLDHKEAKNDMPDNGEDSVHQVFAQTKLSALKTYMNLVDGDLTKDQQFTSWAALPILNEWKKQFPGKDPLQVHYDYFKETIHCPGGKGYQWNEAIDSMESVAFGHPEAPRDGFVEFPIFEKWEEAKAAIGLKDNEFRLEAELKK
jgi:hypothetical protein